MFHATLLMISTCFIHIICHYYAFSGTNLLTRCRRASSCFLLFLVPEILVKKYSRNRTKSNAQHPIFPRSFQNTREPPERGHRGPTHGGGAARAGPAPP